MARRPASLFAPSLAFALVLCTLAPARAQLPDCSGHDAAAASAEFEAGNSLLAQAIDQASHRHPDRAAPLATEALAHFDRQCELGDTSAFAERGAALLLLAEPLRSAQSYDAYLATHPLDSLEARTRRRIEPNLQPGALDLEIENARGRLFLNDLDFGALPRTTNVRIPYGEYRIEVRDDTGTVLASASASLSAESAHATAQLVLAPLEAGPTLPPPEEVHVAPLPVPPVEPPPSRTDFLPFYIASAATAGVGVALGIGFVVAADERARTYNATCNPVAVAGCSSVLSERETDLDVAIVGFVVGGLGIAGLVATWILDANEPRARVRMTFGPTGVGVSGTF